MNLAFKRTPRKGIHRKLHGLTFLQPADIGLGHGCFDLHFCEVIRDNEKRRGIHGRGHRLAGLDFPRDDDPVHGRVNRGAAQVNLRAIDVGLAGLQHSLGLAQADSLLVELGFENGWMQEYEPDDRAFVPDFSRPDSWN